jgi:glycosyltransferase involved in cell wall biosynthesis
MSLRILHVLRPDNSDAGRSAEAVCKLAADQRQFGHIIEVVTLGEPIGDWMGRLEIPVHVLGARKGAYGYSPQFVVWMREHAEAYDCVIVHGIWNFCGLGTWWALRDATVPYFIFTHGMLDPWLKTHHPFRHLLRWLYWLWGVYPVLRDAHAVFFLGDDERHMARQAFWLYDCHEFVVRFGSSGIPPSSAGSDSEEFLSAHPQLRGQRLFMFFADFESVEGIRLLVSAINLLSVEDDWDAHSMRLVIACTGDQTAHRVAESYAAKCGIRDSVYWAGPLTEHESWGAMRTSEVFLRPSSFEVCSNRVAEALSSGTPVLVSKGVAIWKDVVGDGAGFADERTPERFARLIREWIKLSDGDRKAARMRARYCYENRYTQVGAAHTLTSAIYLLVGVHRDGRWALKPIKPASELT